MTPLLRTFKQEDATRLQQILNDADMVKFLSSRIPFPYTSEDATWWINEGSHNGFVRAIDIDGKLVGCVGVTPGIFEYSHCGEIGYWLAKDYWGNGIMTKAVNQLVEFIFTQTDISRLFAVVFSANRNSQNLLKRCGFEREAILKKAICKNGVYYDNHQYVKLKSSV
ncbi:MAG: GNAT family N-acetyltransferase [Alteromonadaceae bacterium]|nr:GNAT family N-acetyltransferase [Alteromonadaceae bacterium]